MPSLGVVELLNHLPLGGERHRRRVPGVERPRDRGSTLCQEQRDKRVPEVVRAKCLRRATPAARARPWGQVSGTGTSLVRCLLRQREHCRRA